MRTTIAVENNRGLTPEEIAADRPPLSLAQIYAALAFYHANKQEIDADIIAEDRAYDEGVRSSHLPLLPSTGSLLRCCGKRQCPRFRFSSP